MTTSNVQRTQSHGGNTSIGSSNRRPILRSPTRAIMAAACLGGAMLFTASSRPNGFEMTLSADQGSSSSFVAHRADIIDDIIEIIDILLGGGGGGSSGGGDGGGDGSGSGGGGGNP